MNARTISPELVAAFKRLRLGGLLPTLPERLTLAEKQNTPLEDVLLLLLSDEISRRDSTAATRRVEQAGLDPDMTLERWDKTAKVTYDRRVLNELVSLRFVEDHRNVVILGPVGVGKTFLASALGHLACRAGYNVRFHRADELLRLLKQSRMDNSRDALMTALATVDVLVIDDFALEPMTRDESRDVYQLFVERNARFTTVVTSNRDTADLLPIEIFSWREDFPRPRTARRRAPVGSWSAAADSRLGCGPQPALRFTPSRTPFGARGAS
jgi:DNA replication protein DnaC